MWIVTRVDSERVRRKVGSCVPWLALFDILLDQARLPSPSWRAPAARTWMNGSKDGCRLTYVYAHERLRPTRNFSPNPALPSPPWRTVFRGLVSNSRSVT